MGERENPPDPEPTDPVVPDPPEPPPPFKFDDVEFKLADNGVLAVRLGQGRIGKASIPTGLAGAFLEHLDGVILSFAADLMQRKLGGRGPYPALPGVSGLALSGFRTDQSVVFEFIIAGGEAATLVGDDVHWTTMDASRQLVGLLSAVTAEGIQEEVATLPQRAAVKVRDLTALLAGENIATSWRVPDGPPVALTPAEALTLQHALELELGQSVEFLEKVGVLSEADADRTTFQLRLPEQKRRIRVHFGSEVAPAVAAAFTKNVRLRVKLTRTTTAGKVIERYDLVDILAMSDAPLSGRDESTE
jgi:hypothetical protein